MPETDLPLLIEAAQQAGQIANHFFERSARAWDKPHGAGPVTEADLAVDEALREILGSARPDYGWLSEESEDAPERLETTRQFIVDPIDGTRAFIARDRTWAHALATCQDGQITAAVVYLPQRDEMFTAARGQGAALNGVPISITPRPELAGCRVLARKAMLAPELWPGGVPDIDLHYRPALAYRLAAVAAGRFDAMLTLRPTWEWDVAAGALLVSEAGGVVTDPMGRTPRFNQPQAQLPGLLAASARPHEQMLTALRAPDA